MILGTLYIISFHVCTFPNLISNLCDFIEQLSFKYNFQLVFYALFDFLKKIRLIHYYYI